MTVASRSDRSLQRLQQLQAVHARHVDVAQHEVEVRPLTRRFPGPRRRPGRTETRVRRRVTCTAKPLDNERLQVGLVIDDKDADGHVAGLLPREAAVDFVAQHAEVDRLGQKPVRAAVHCPAPRVGIAIGGDHDDRQVRAQGLYPRQQFKTAHARHVDVRQKQDEPAVIFHRQSVQRLGRRKGEFHVEASRPEVAAELLAEQRLHVRLVVDDENQHFHAALPLFWFRGTVTLNAVNSPGCGFDVDGAAMLLDDDVVRQRQAESRAFAGRLGREERLEDPGLDIVGYPGAIVADA